MQPVHVAAVLFKGDPPVAGHRDAPFEPPVTGESVHSPAGRGIGDETVHVFSQDDDSQNPADPVSQLMRLKSCDIFLQQPE